MGRKPGAPLSREQVIETAIRCIADEGPGALGINRVARALDIRPPSLYHHVASNEDLARLVAIEGWRRLAARMTDRPASADPGASIEALASTYRRFVSDHPGLYRVMNETPLNDDPEFHPVGFAIMQDFTQVLGRYGLHGDDVVHAVRTLRAALHGFVLLEQSGQFGMAQSIEESFAWLIAHFRRMLARESA